MASGLPRVNFLSIIAGVVALVSIFVPWWGITTTVLGSTTSDMWGLFGGPGPSRLSDAYGAQNFSSTITTYSPIILAAVLVSTALAIAGSFTARHRILGIGLATSIGGLVGYAALISYATSNSCSAQDCVRQATGSFTFPVISGRVNWGFQLGFYMFFATTILVLVGLVFHQTLTGPRQKNSP